MKKFLIGVVILIVIIAGAAYYLFSSLDGLVKTAIEKAGSEATGVKVTVADVKIDLSKGTGSVQGITIGNPPGYSTSSAFALGEISIVLDPAKIMKSPREISQVSIVGPEVTYELNANGGSNIQTLQDHIMAASSGAKSSTSSASSASPASSQSAETNTAATKSEDNGSSNKIVLDRLDITKGKVKLATPVPGSTAEATLGDIHMTNIGRSSNGVTEEQLAQVVLQALSKAAVNAAATANPEQMLKGVLSGQGTSGTQVDKAVDGLKGLLGK